MYWNSFFLFYIIYKENDVITFSEIPLKLFKEKNLIWCSIGYEFII